MIKLTTVDAIQPDESLYGVVFRGKPWARITAADYDEAIAALQEAKSQLEPDGDNCHVCHDSGHQAWECHHNPLAMARLAASAEHQWRCFHCGSLFTDYQSAREHFGPDENSPATCVISETGRDAIRLTLKACEDLENSLVKNHAAVHPADVALMAKGKIIVAAKAAGIQLEDK